MSNIHTMVFHSALKKNEITIHATTWMNPENIMLGERSQTPKTWYMIPFDEISRIGKSIETESRFSGGRSDC